MAFPWLMILDTALGLGDVVRRARRPSAKEGAQPLARSARSGGWVEARLVGVFVAALREAFDRDHERLEMERAQVEADRRRALQALRLELLRQSGDRETGRLRLVAGVAGGCWLAALFFVSGQIESTLPARAVFGVGWTLLLASLAGSLVAQLRIARQMERIARLELSTRAGTADEVGQVSFVESWDQDAEIEPVTTGIGGTAAPWLLIAGLAVMVLGVFLL